VLRLLAVASAPPATATSASSSAACSAPDRLPSGTSRIARIATTASSSSGVATRKLSATPSPYACRTTAATGPGRLRTSGIALPPGSAGAPMRPRPTATDLVTECASTAPSTATPIAPPSERKNETVAVAAPS